MNELYLGMATLRKQASGSSTCRVCAWLVGGAIGWVGPHEALGFLEGRTGGLIQFLCLSCVRDWVCATRR